MSVSDEQYKRVLDFADNLIEEKSTWLLRALKAERRLMLVNALAITGWVIVCAIVIVELTT